MIIKHVKDNNVYGIDQIMSIRYKIDRKFILLNKSKVDKLFIQVINVSEPNWSLLH